jgi:hypothetical protein
MYDRQGVGSGALVISWLGLCGGGSHGRSGLRASMRVGGVVFGCLGRVGWDETWELAYGRGRRGDGRDDGLGTRSTGRQRGDGIIDAAMNLSIYI